MSDRTGFLLGALLVAGCSGGDDDAAPGEFDLEEVQAFMEEAADAGPCDEVFADGVTVTFDGLSATCIDDTGDARIFGTAWLDCTNGTRLAWNDLGWAILDEDSGQFVLHEPDAEKTPPDDLYETCASGPADLTPCEQAWEDGLGNAGQPGVERESWIDDCRAEGGDETLGG